MVFHINLPQLRQMILIINLLTLSLALKILRILFIMNKQKCIPVVFFLFSNVNKKKFKLFSRNCPPHISPNLCCGQQ